MWNVWRFLVLWKNKKKKESGHGRTRSYSCNFPASGILAFANYLSCLTVGQSGNFTRTGELLHRSGMRAICGSEIFQGIRVARPALEQDTVGQFFMLAQADLRRLCNTLTAVAASNDVNSTFNVYLDAMTLKATVAVIICSRMGMARERAGSCGGIDKRMPLLIHCLWALMWRAPKGYGTPENTTKGESEMNPIDLFWLFVIFGSIFILPFL